MEDKYAFLGNMIMVQMKKEKIFPVPYSKGGKLPFTAEEREKILIIIMRWQRELKCSNMSKGQLINELPMYAKLRADLLIAARNQVQGLLRTPEQAEKCLLRRNRPSLCLSLTRRCISYEILNNYATPDLKQEEEEKQDSGISVGNTLQTVECDW